LAVPSVRDNPVYHVVHGSTAGGNEKLPTIRNMAVKNHLNNAKTESAAPWFLSFDRKNRIWSIDGDRDLSIARIHCGLDGWNHERRVAAHLMAEADRLYTYIRCMAKAGDTEASAIAERIEGDLAGEDETIETVDDYLAEAYWATKSGIKKSEFYARAGGQMKRDEDEAGPWRVVFDKSCCIWSILAGQDLHFAVVSGAFDGRNAERRVAAHLMANAQRMYAYVRSKHVAGDIRAGALHQCIEAGLAGEDDAIEGAG
jgi:hypothetical protein